MTEKMEAPLEPVTRSVADAMALSLFDDSSLRRQVRSTGKLSMDALWYSLGRVIIKAALAGKPKAIDPLQIHNRLLKGLPGEAMFIASAMAFDTFKEGEAFFGVSTKTARQRIGRNLDTSESEKALRLARALGMATKALGDVQKARDYLKTPNFALGGMTPRELLRTAEGEQLVLNEIQAHAEGGPV